MEADPKRAGKVPVRPAGKREFMLNSKLKEMKKLESLKSSKYSLTPEKMGRLVGGAVCCTTSEAGAYGTDCSCDVVYHYSGEDVQLNSNGKPITESYSPLYGKRDTELQSLLISQNGGLCK